MDTEPDTADRARRRALAAATIVSARLQDGELLAALPPDIRPPNEREAYNVQRVSHSLLPAAGFGARAGWKIGCTTVVMQEFLGISSPCAGGMFEARIWRGEHRFPTPAAGRLGVECEIAVRLGSELVPGDDPVDDASAARSIAACMASIEIVEDRYLEYSALDAATLIADDFFHHGCVLGPEIEDFSPFELAAVTAEMEINGAPVGTGTGADILGDPLRALAWLANSAAAWGVPLQAGEVVTLGSLVQTQWVEAGDRVTVHNSRLGGAAASFGA